MDEPIYITGAGIISAIGNNKHEVLCSLREKHSGIGTMHYLQSEHTELPVGEVKLSDEQMRAILSLDKDCSANRTSLMGTIAMKEALEDANILSNVSNIMLISGTTVGGMDYTERCFLDLQNSDDNLKILATHDCGSTTQLQADYFGINRNNVITISTACSSAANAIIVGANLIKTGKAEIVIAGGSEAITKFHLNGFNSLLILDYNRCRPFDANRLGLNLGEGAAYIVLESERSIRKRNIQPIGELLGYGNACDAFHQTASSPNGEGADGEINVREFLSPIESRRMCRLLKTAFITSKVALREAHIDRPDGIFIGTKYGMLSNSEKFLQQMCLDGEHTLGPTLFMQSTHNTIAGMLAINTKCHGYNITFSQGDESLSCAIRDAALQIAMGNIDNALVGCHDEYTPLFSDMFCRLTGVRHLVGEYSTSMVLSHLKEGAIEEFTDF